MKNENLSSNVDNIFYGKEDNSEIEKYFNDESDGNFINKMDERKEDNDKYSIFGNPINNKKKLYTFKLDEIIELKKYLKNNVVGQDHIIDSYIDFFVLNTNRTKEGPISPVILQFGPSGSGKNMLPKLIAEKLWFGIYIIDLSTMFYAETSSLLGATSGFDSGEKSIFENIQDIASNYDGRMVVIIDEIEKGQISKGGGAAGDLSSFLQNFMNIIQVNGKIYTKNNNTEINMDNWMFIFNSNLGFDKFSFDEDNTNRKIGFAINDKKERKKVKEIDIFTAEDFEMILKKNYGVSVSVMNRLKKGNNFFIFNEISRKTYFKHIDRRYNELIDELKETYGNYKYPSLEYFEKYFSEFDFRQGFRGINDIIDITIKGKILKEIIFKDFYKKIKF